MARTRTLSVFTALTLVGCASPSATISVTAGPVADAGELGCQANAIDPSVTSFELDAVQPGGQSQKLADGGLSQSSVDLGDVSEAAIASLQLTGRDASGNAVVFGATPFVQLGALDGATIPLFVQRKGELACMPGTIADARTAPLLATTPRGIYYAGGNVAGATGFPVFGGYDLLFLEGFGTTCEVGVDARSFSLIDLLNENGDGDLAVAALIGDNALYEIGLPSCSSSPITDEDLAEAGSPLSSWSELGGGRSVTGDDGTGYVVGPSKLDVPSNAVESFSIGDADGGASVASTGVASQRQGAAVTWLPNQGMFIYGGAGNPNNTPGAEIVSSALKASVLDYPLEQVQGLAAAVFDTTHVLVAGDDQPARLVDLACIHACTPAPWGQALPFVLSTPSLFALGNGAFLIVGDDASGATHVFRLTATDAPKEISFKIPRQQARAIQTETGEIVILGGGSDVPESYFD